MLNILNNIKRIIRIAVIGDLQDPIRHCAVHRNIGCAHVDGFLCEMNTCDIKRNYDLQIKQ